MAYTFLNNTYSYIPKDDNRNRLEVEIGDSKQPDFYPQVKIQRWDNEANFSARLIENETGTATITTEIDQIVWKKGKKEARFYETNINHFQELKNLDLGNYISTTLGKIEFSTSPNPIITMDGVYWAGDNAQEREIRRLVAEKASGKVLVVGLGLGVINEYLKTNPKVTSITVVEFSQEVVDIVQANYPSRLSGINLVVADYFEYAKNTTDKYDYIYGDIFSQITAPYFKKWERFIASATPLLKPNGVIDGRIKETYENTKDESYDEPGYEFEITLLEKPLTNKIEFSLVDKNAQYLYQPPLTQEILAKAGETLTETTHLSSSGLLLGYRPENVVGSYAIYHPAPPPNYEGGKVYATGKIGHIYRPKIIDAIGTEVWGDLHIENGIMTVTVPQDFLDNAVYPIRHAAGATFGYTTAGTSGETATGDNITGSVFPGAAGTGTSITVAKNAWLPAATAANVYVHSDLAKLANGLASGTWTDNSPSAGFATKAFDVAPTFTAVDYVLVLWSINTKGGSSIKYDSGDTNQGHQQSLTWGTWPDPLVPTHNNNKYSIYVTYEASTTTSTSTTSSSSTSSTSSSSSTSSTSSSSSSTSTTISPLSGGLAWGQQIPTEGETAVSWKTWDNGSGGAAIITGDADWGKLTLQLNAEGRSKVYSFGDETSRSLTITPNRYEAGSGSATLQIRGQATVFTQDNDVLEWTTYSVPTVQTWKYVQVRVIKT